ncbi:DUF4126 family protein [Sphingomicrobium sp. XHP0235]|uniref:DUF4126 family protein n=1 Tax=Sphingomicrobium aquimarinum TaxID=3133971 RepID=UPI0031FF2E70
MILLLLLAAAVGFLTGARTFVPIAIVAFAATYGWLDLTGTGLGWLGNVAPVAILILLAMGELYGDKQPDAGNRTNRVALVGRIAVGALAGAALALGAQAGASGPAAAVAGGVGAAIGTCLTFRARAGLIERHGRIAGALIEDAFVTLATCCIVWAVA